MADPYKRIFDTDGFVTEAQMRQLLDLPADLSVKLTELDINRAYRAKVLKVHPDKQDRQPSPLSAEDSNALFDDVKLAREHLLKGDTSVPGRAFAQRFTQPEEQDWLQFIIEILADLTDYTQTIDEYAYWGSWLSADYTFIWVLALPVEGELLFSLLHEMKPFLDMIRPYLEQLDGIDVKQWLLSLKELVANEALEENLEALKALLPQQLLEDPKLDDLMSQILTSREALVGLLNDNFIKNLTHIANYWPNLVRNIPTWRQLCAAYLLSLTCTATNLPRYIKSHIEILALIESFKGNTARLVVFLPMLVSSVLLLPLNFMIQMSWQMGGVLLSAGLSGVVHATTTLLYGAHFLASLLGIAEADIKVDLYQIVNGLNQLAIKGFVCNLLELVDVALYWLISDNYLQGLIASLSAFSDDALNVYKPQKLIDAEQQALQNEATGQDLYKLLLAEKELQSDHAFAAVKHPSEISTEQSPNVSNQAQTASKRFGFFDQQGGKGLQSKFIPKLSSIAEVDEEEEEMDADQQAKVVI